MGKIEWAAIDLAKESQHREEKENGFCSDGHSLQLATNGESTSTSNKMRRAVVDVTESSSVLENASKKRRLSETQTEIHKKETENVESHDDPMETENPV